MQHTWWESLPEQVQDPPPRSRSPAPLHPLPTAQDYIDISSSLPFTPITLVFQDLK